MNDEKNRQKNADTLNEVINQYVKRVSLGSYVPCEICGALHDDGGLMMYKGKEVYACLDCMEK